MGKTDPYLDGDLAKVIFFVYVYTIEGFGFGFLLTTFPILMASKLTLTQIGILAFGNLAYDLKFVYSIFVDTYHVGWLGKYKTYLILPKLLAFATLLFLWKNIDHLVENERIYTIMGAFMLINFGSALQDVAIYGWTVKLLKPQNIGYGAISKTIGLRVGVFISITVFLALNSTDFGNKFLYASLKDEPLLDASSFFFVWGILSLILVFYVFFFTSDKDSSTTSMQKHEQKSMVHVIKMGMKIIQNKNMLKLIAFFILQKALCYIPYYLSEVYLVKNLGYSTEKMSYIKALTFPIGLLLNSLFSPYLHPLLTYFHLHLLYLFNSLFCINLVFYFYTYFLAYPTLLDILILLSFTVNEGVGVMMYTSKHTFGVQIADLEFIMTHGTLYTGLYNFTRTIPKIYTYKIVENYGIFVPNFGGVIITFGIMGAFRGVVKQLDVLKKEDWSPQISKKKIE